MLKKKNISRKDAQKEIAQRDPYVGILLEDMNDKFKILIEGNDALEAKIDKIDAKWEAFREEADERLERLEEDKADKKDLRLLEYRIGKLKTT